MSRKVQTGKQSAQLERGLGLEEVTSSLAVNRRSESDMFEKLARSRLAGTKHPRKGYTSLVSSASYTCHKNGRIVAAAHWKGLMSSNLHPSVSSKPRCNAASGLTAQARLSQVVPSFGASEAQSRVLSRLPLAHPRHRTPITSAIECAEPSSFGPSA